MHLNEVKEKEKEKVLVCQGSLVILRFEKWTKSVEKFSF